MRIFYADYENIQSAGLEGIELMTCEDKVYVFYSPHAESIKIGVVRQIMSSPASVEFVEADTGTENALDFQLVASLFMDLKDENEYYIVSRDTGFDAAVKMAVRSGHENVHRIQNLMKLLRPEADIIELPKEGILTEIDEIICEKCDKRTSEKYGELVMTGLRTSDNKNQFYQFFRKHLGDSEGGDLYRSIRSKFDEMKALV